MYPYAHIQLFDPNKTYVITTGINLIVEPYFYGFSCVIVMSRVESHVVSLFHVNL